MTNRPVAAAIVTEYGRSNACTRYRVLQHMGRLEAMLGRINLYLPDTDVPIWSTKAGRVRFFARHAARYAQRYAQLRRDVPCHDRILVQRAAYPMGPAGVVRPLVRFSGRLVLDLDDAVFLVSPVLAERSRAARWLYGGAQARALLDRADAIVVSTESLAGLLPGGRAADAILPTVPDPTRYRVAEHVDRVPAVIGWVGTAGNRRYLDEITSVCERLAGTAMLEVVSSAPWHGAASFRPWSEAEEAVVFARFDIGVMPLIDTPYTRAKAGFKLLQYMAAGVPVVASPVGINRSLVERSGAGFLASNEDEWFQALRTLAVDVDLRSRMGAAGRRFIEGYADLEHQAQTLAAILRG